MLKLTIFVVTVLASTLAQKSAVVYIHDPKGQNNVTGNITFQETQNGIKISGVVLNLIPGKHGFHVHQLGSITPDCTAAGSHFNPYNKTHGAPEDENRHVGDLGNIVALENGTAIIDFNDTVITLSGTNDIIGKSIVVHELEDDLGKGNSPESLTTGNAGARLACGVIVKSSASTGQISAVLLLISVISFCIKI